MRLSRRESGASMVEYSLIAALIAVMSFPVIALAGHSTSDSFDTVSVAMADRDGAEGASTTTTTTLPKQGDTDNSGSSGGGGGGGGPAPTTTTTTLPPTTTTTTLPPATTTTTLPPATTTTTAPPAAPGSTAKPTKTSSEYYWFNQTKKGGEGAWKATVAFQNDWIRHQYLTLEVTRIDEKGKRTTSTVTDFYVPAGGSAAFDSYDNAIKIDGATQTGTVSVEVKVVSIKTSDEKWQTVTYKASGPITTVGAPKNP